MRSRLLFGAWFAWAYVYAIGVFPGINFDEAWFSLQAHKYLTLTDLSFFGMNSHSGSLPQFFLAALYAVFQNDVSTYRIGFLALSTLGFLALALQRRSWVWLLLVLATPIAFFQLRMGLEVSHFFIAAFALIYGPVSSLIEGQKLSRTQQALWVLGLFLGVWTHALFLSVLLAIEVWGLVFDKEGRLLKNLPALHWAHVCLAPLFVQMLWTSKWGLKALGVLLGLAALSMAWLFWQRWATAKRRTYLKIFFIAAGLHCVFNFLIFFDGSWNMLLYTGRNWWPGLVVGLWFLVAAMCVATQTPTEAAKKWAALTFCLVVISGLMTVTWAPKSFLLPVLFTAFTFEKLIREQRFKQIFILALVLPGIVFQGSALRIERTHAVRNTSFHLGLLKDSSYDTLPNVEIYRDAKNQNLCTDPACLRIDDPRLKQIFAALDQLEGSTQGDGQMHRLSHCNKLSPESHSKLVLHDENFCFLKDDAPTQSQ